MSIIYIYLLFEYIYEKRLFITSLFDNLNIILSVFNINYIWNAINILYIMD